MSSCSRVGIVLFKVCKLQVNCGVNLLNNAAEHFYLTRPGLNLALWQGAHKLHEKPLDYNSKRVGSD